jgi:hypothetical protein
MIFGHTLGAAKFPGNLPRHGLQEVFVEISTLRSGAIFTIFYVYEEPRRRHSRKAPLRLVLMTKRTVTRSFFDM